MHLCQDVDAIKSCFSKIDQEINILGNLNPYEDDKKLWDDFNEKITKANSFDDIAIIVCNFYDNNIGIDIQLFETEFNETIEVIN